MMQKEIENVRRQKDMACAKLDLYNNLSSEYDEQMRLIKEQVSIDTLMIYFVARPFRHQ